MTRAAVGQICSTSSMSHNLEQCVSLVAKAAAAGAKVLFLPEASDYIASSGQESLSLARPITSSSFVTGLQSAAAKHRLAVHVGIHVPVTVKKASASSTALSPIPATSQIRDGPSPLEARDAESPLITKLYNRTIWIDEEGKLDEKKQYDKLHLFDYPAGGLRESAGTQAGTSLTPPFPSPIGRLGGLICFDLRFPEPSLALAQPLSPSSPWHATPAQVLLYPSAFTVPTGRAHWEVLLRARAVECQSWVVASAQVGKHNDKRVSYGKSMVVDPWGKVVVELKGVGEDGEVEEGAIGELGVWECDLEEVDKVRERMPLIRRR